MVNPVSSNGGSAARGKENPLTKKSAIQEGSGPGAAINQNIEGFKKQKGLIVGERVDHVAANR